MSACADSMQQLHDDATTTLRCVSNQLKQLNSTCSRKCSMPSNSNLPEHTTTALFDRVHYHRESSQESNTFSKNSGGPAEVRTPNI